MGGIIEALPKLKKEIGDINFIVLGDGSEMENLKKLAEEIKVGGNVHFLGKICHDEIMDYFRASDLFILNTNYEGLSHAILEAIMAGAPVITTDIEANREVIGNNRNGLLVRFNNKEEIFEAALKILTNKQLAQDLTANAREGLKKFNWSDNIEATVKLIKRVSHE